MFQPLTHPPSVVILRQAMEVIQRESLKCGMETGGIGVGRRSEGGTLFVTHATPPGPRAVHRMSSFRNDVDYQQKALNALHARYGVEYFLEWHKHPAGAIRPSGIDHDGCLRILGDPDYGIDSLLFPIVTCDATHGFSMYLYWISTEHPVFERHGDDIYVLQEIDLVRAALGGELNGIPGLEGNVQLEIPEGTQNGAVFRIVDKGAPHLNNYGRGDQYVVMKVVTPTDLTEKEKELLRKVQELREKRSN